jgi:cysteine-rich repeat protein
VADGICGNGTIEPGEQCDDGNNSDGDLCPSSAISGCSYRDSGALIHGNERRQHVRRDGCQLEWYVAHHDLSRNRSGAAATTQVCSDQDLGCDFDSSGRQCRFMVVACFNNTDPGLPACAPRELTSFRIVHPRRIRSAGNTGGDNRRTLQEAFAALVDPAQPELGAIHGFPLLSGQTNLCSLPFPLNVRLLGNNRGAEDVIVDTFSDDGRGLRRHRSRLRLICVP